MKVAYLTNVLPAYRTDFFRRLLSDSSLNVTVFCHADVHGSQVQLMESRFKDRFVHVPTRSLFGDRVIWESMPYERIFREHDVIIGDGNPRHVGFLIACTLGRLFGKRVIIWSTLHSRRNHSVTQFLRLGWWRMFREFLSYTDQDAQDIVDHGLAKVARGTNNGLDQELIDRTRELYTDADLEAFKAEAGLAGKPVLLSLGRVLPGRFDLMTEVLDKLRGEGSDARWVLIGSGEGMDSLKQRFEAAGLTDRVVFPGAIHDEETLAKWFGIADLFVYPEAIGLSLYHAFGYGLPVVAHSDLEIQGPEMAIFEEGRTGLTFERGNADDMAAKIRQLLGDDAARARMGERALDLVRNEYNSRVMHERLAAALHNPL